MSHNSKARAASRILLSFFIAISMSILAAVPAASAAPIKESIAIEEENTEERGMYVELVNIYKWCPTCGVVSRTYKYYHNINGYTYLNDSFLRVEKNVQHGNYHTSNLSVYQCNYKIY